MLKVVVGQGRSDLSLKSIGVCRVRLDLSGRPSGACQVLCDGWKRSCAILLRWAVMVVARRGACTSEAGLPVSFS